MTSIRFTSNIHRHVSAPSVEVEARTVGEALELRGVRIAMAKQG